MTQHKHSGPQGPLQGSAKRGFDAPYGKQAQSGREELDATMAGPQKQEPVRADDTELKNPDGDLDAPCANPRPR
jgi:hypothetical protein